MKNFLPKLFAGAALMTATTSNAQLADGSIAPNWTFTDINGNSHTLYDYLDNGYTVYLDFFAAWCGPCWSYHNSGAFDDLYTDHGPAGMSGVSASTTDDVMVFMMESELTNTATQLTTSTGSTYATSSQGNWLTGTTEPIIDLPSSGSSTLTGYNIGYFPTIYMICPNRVITEVGQINEASLYSAKGTCPAPASMATDAALLDIPNTDAVICAGGTLLMKTRLQNNGTTPLTSAVITAYQGATPIGTTTFSGSLNTYDISDVTIGTSPTLSGATTLTYTVTAAGDGASTNDSKNLNVTASTLAPASSLITVSITTDRYGSETEWTIENSAGSVVGSGGPFTTMSANGAYPQPDVNLHLPADCYTFTITDQYGDGMCCSYGAGAYAVKVTGAASFTTGGTFGSSETKKFKNSAGTTGELEVFTENAITVYPNPTNSDAFVDVNLVNASTVTIQVVNNMGQTVFTTTKGMNSGYNTEKISLSHLPSGMYHVNVLAGQTAISKKISVVK